jgi:hypothetical protein
MFLGYLLGYNPFEPSIVPPRTIVEQSDLVLTVTLSGSKFLVNAHQPDGKSYEAEIKESQNSAVFQLLRRAVCAEFKPSYKTLKIVAKQDYIVNAINRGEVNTDRKDFAELQFHLLRFVSVSASKG